MPMARLKSVVIHLAAVGQAEVPVEAVDPLL
jgi:hypothetical protein